MKTNHPSERTYRDICPQGTPEAVRRKYNIGDILLNQAKCLLCGEMVVSNHRHDFVTCSCGSVGVDGGSWYSKRLFKAAGCYEDQSIPYEQDVASSIE